jgi:hypothetical protein
MFTLPRMMLSLAVASTSAGGGCGELLFAEVETEQVCKTLEPTELPGNPAGLSLGHRVTGQVDLREELPLEDALEGDVQLTSLTLQLPAGGPTLDFIDSAHVDVAPVGSATGGTRVVDYTHGAGVGHTLELYASAPLNLLELSRQGPVEIAIGLSGTSPAEAWTVTPRVCFSARVKVDYADLTK